MTEFVDGDDDPRLDGKHVRRVTSDDCGDVLLLGVVHDHPASRHRVRTVIEGYDPDVLGLEVAPLALPAFEAAAREAPWAPGGGDEMSDAVAAAPGARVVGIDGLDAAFFATLLRTLVAERPPLAEVRSLARSVTAVAKEAAAYRVATIVRRFTPFRPTVGEPVEHGCGPTDPPAVQAADERSQTATSLAFLRAIDPPARIAIRDDTREACMVRRLDVLRQEGDVAAVIGLGHVDPVAAGLADLD